MSDTARHSKFLPLTFAVLAGALFSLAVFVGWIRYGGAIFLSLIESGLAYCF